MAKSKPNNEERVRARAHEIWEQSGRPDGHHLAHWRQAEAEINGKAAPRAAAKPKAAAAKSKAAAARATERATAAAKPKAAAAKPKAATAAKPKAAAPKRTKAAAG
jgi:hypothetical protein